MKSVVIIGGGPAGLTAAYILLKEYQGQFNVTIIEKENILGGISRTIKNNENLIDIGGHRFFSKNKQINNLFKEILPVQSDLPFDYKDTGVNVCVDKNNSADPNIKNEVFLIRNRMSRIFYENNFFDYPLKINFKTILKFGFIELFLIALSFLREKFNRKEIKNLEDFFISRFGKRLYLKFFKHYTEKVWGEPCINVSHEWGAQRIKKISLTEIFLSLFTSNNKHTSLIESFMYPKFGPGQFWETMGKKIIEMGGVIERGDHVISLKIKDDKQFLVATEKKSYKGDICLSTASIKDLLCMLDPAPPREILEISNNLEYRDFVTVGLLFESINLKNNTSNKTSHGYIPDNWMYIQDRSVSVGRIQFFNNWSPYMVEDINKPWLGLEFFAQEGDEFWNKSDSELIDISLSDLNKIGIIDKSNRLVDSIVVRVPKAYPKYTGSYDCFSKVKDYILSLDNFYSLGRNGMHRYNNQDHSMLTAIETVNHITKNITTKESPWNVNSDDEYHEEQS